VASEQEMLNALTPGGITRGGATRGGDACPQTRGAQQVDDQQDNTTKPTYNLTVTFATDSSDLETDGRMALNALASVLKNPSLRCYRFNIAGHTDAAGSFEYNQALSDRRARAVVKYLTEEGGISSDRLTWIGYGKTRLLDPDNPTSRVNRRVQITNLGFP
jgi:outer membrane protein OmpA-like peptidoglycan-associated protein